MTVPVNDAPEVAVEGVEEEVPALLGVEVGGDVPAVAAAPLPPAVGLAVRALRWLGPPAAAFGVFALFLLLKGASPAEAFEAMWRSAFGDGDALGETVLRTCLLYTSDAADE